MANSKSASLSLTRVHPLGTHTQPRSRSSHEPQQKQRLNIRRSLNPVKKGSDYYSEQQSTNFGGSKLRKSRDKLKLAKKKKKRYFPANQSSFDSQNTLKGQAAVPGIYHNFDGMLGSRNASANFSSTSDIISKQIRHDKDSISLPLLQNMANQKIYDNSRYSASSQRQRDKLKNLKNIAQQEVAQIRQDYGFDKLDSNYPLSKSKFGSSYSQIAQTEPTSRSNSVTLNKIQTYTLDHYNRYNSCNLSRSRNNFQLPKELVEPLETDVQHFRELSSIKPARTLLPVNKYFNDGNESQNEESFKFNTIDNAKFQIRSTLLPPNFTPDSKLRTLTNASLNSQVELNSSKQTLDVNAQSKIDRELDLCMLNCPQTNEGQFNFFFSVLKDKISEIHRMKSEYCTLFDRFEKLCSENDTLLQENDQLKAQNQSFVQEIKNYEIRYSPSKSNFRTSNEFFYQNNMKSVENKENIFIEIDDRNTEKFHSKSSEEYLFFNHGRDKSSHLSNNWQSGSMLRKHLDEFTKSSNGNGPRSNSKEKKKVSFSKITSVVGSVNTNNPNSPKILFSEAEYKDMMEYNKKSHKFFRILAKTANELTSSRPNSYRKGKGVFSESKQKKLWKWLKGFFKDYMDVKMELEMRKSGKSLGCKVRNMR